MTFIPTPRRILGPMLAGLLLLGLLAPTALATHQITIQTPTEAQAFSRNQTIAFEVKYTNNNCQNVHYDWNLGGGLRLNTTSKTFTYAFPFNATTGTRQLSVTTWGTPSNPNQPNCQPDTAFRNITLNPNTAPVAALAAIPSPLAPGATIALDAAGSTDADGAADLKSYAFYIDGVLLQNTSASSMTTSLLPAGTHTAMVRVFDHLDATSSASRTFTITNVAPVASLAEVSPFTAGNALNLVGSGSTDANGNGDITRYAFLINGDEVANGTASTFTMDPWTVAGTFTATLRVGDAGGLWSEASREFTVGPGPLATVHVAPQGVIVPYNLTQQFAAMGADAFGNPVAVTPVWSSACAPASGGYVDHEGLFTANSTDAECTVTATSGDAFDTASLQVRAPTLPVPQLPTLVLTAVGLVALLGVVGWRRRQA